MIDDIFEMKVLANLKRVQKFANIASQYIKPGYFESEIRHNLCKIFVDYTKKYHTNINDFAFAQIIKKLYEDKKIDKERIEYYVELYQKLDSYDISDSDFILDNLIDFIKHKEYKKVIEEAITKYLPQNNLNELEKELSQISNISATPKAEPYDYWAKITERTEKREEELLCRSVGITTGIKKLDDALYKNGWYNGELYVIVAPPKRGKSMSLIWFSNVASLVGLNVGYWTHEVSADIIADRLDALNTETKIKLLKTNAKDVEKKINQLSNNKGKIFIFDYPTNTCSVNQIREDIKKLEIQGHRLDMVVTDYADIMRPNYRIGDKWQEEASIYIDLRGLAKERQVPVLTASQVTKSGSNKELTTGSDSAGSWDKIKIADLVLTINATEEEKQQNKARLNISENRNGESRVITINTALEEGRFYKGLVSSI